MKEKKYALYGIGIVLISLIGISLAYFATQIVGKEKNISVNTKDLRIIFNNGDAITGVNVVAEDNWSMTKTFSVENKSNSTYKYNIVIKDLINTFKTTGYLQYKITSTDGGYNMTSFEDVPKRSTATDTVLAYSVSIEAGVTQNYTITIQYPNDANIDQSDDMGATLSGKLYISKGSYPTLAEVILRDNPTIKTRTDFSTPFTETTTGTLFTSTESITGITNTPVNVYYYSGNTTNNWVKFGGFYWRIIRTNHDGSIRLLYVGTSHDTTTGNIGTSAFNASSNSPKYVGYKYGEDTSLNTIRNNTTDSTVKAYIDTWYQNNLLTNYDKYISKTAIYCNDRSEETEGSYTTSKTSFNFASFKRLYTDKTPTYNCSDIRDAFSVENTSAKLSYPIALMTADEIAFAGGTAWYANMSTPYAWFISNSSGTEVSSYWWSLSPFYWSVYSAYGWSWGAGSASLYNDSVNDAGTVRPAISLKSCVKVTGRGTADDPYVVDYEGSCK